MFLPATGCNNNMITNGKEDGKELAVAQTLTDKYFPANNFSRVYSSTMSSAFYSSQTYYRRLDLSIASQAAEKGLKRLYSMSC